MMRRRLSSCMDIRIMANNPFSDFSALKSLKKELEKQDDSNNPSKAANEPRRKTVTHKSKDDVLGDQKARETGLQPGMRVTLMDSSDRGVIKRVRKDCVEMTVDEASPDSPRLCDQRSSQDSVLPCRDY